MRGKSARVGSGFVAESPTSPFPPFQLPIKRRFLVETKLQLFSVSSRSNMGFIRRQRITSLSNCTLQSNTAMQPQEAARAVQSVRAT
jgi:hypothetical protein